MIGLLRSDHTDRSKLIRVRQICYGLQWRAATSERCDIIAQKNHKYGLYFRVE